MANKPIPTAKGAPFVGLARPMIANAPEFLLRLATEYGGLVEFTLFGRRFLLVADPDAIREVLVTRADSFPKAARDAEILGRFLGQGLVSNNDVAFHKQQRKLMQPAFHPRRIQNYAGVMVDYTLRLMAGWQAGATRDLSAEMMELTMFIVSRSLYGAGMDEMADEAQTVGAAIETLQGVSNADFQAPVLWPEWLPTGRNRRRKAARAVLYEVIEQLIAARRATAVNGQVQDTGDLLSMLLLARYDDGRFMSDRQARDELVTLFVAGHETTSNALTWSWYLLAQHPQVEAQLHAELDAVLGGRAPTLADLPDLPFTLQIIKETLRLYPPAWVLNTRVAAEDTAVGEYAVPRGRQIFIAPYVMHRLSRYWDNPTRFDPQRFAPEREKEIARYVYLPFGAGPRVCIGNAFALMEAHLIVATIAQRWRFELPPTQTIELQPQITLSNKTGMQMRLMPRA